MEGDHFDSSAVLCFLSVGTSSDEAGHGPRAGGPLKGFLDVSGQTLLAAALRLRKGGGAERLELPQGGAQQKVLQREEEGAGREGQRRAVRGRALQVHPCRPASPVAPLGSLASALSSCLAICGKDAPTSHEESLRLPQGENKRQGSESVQAPVPKGA